MRVSKLFGMSILLRLDLLIPDRYNGIYISFIARELNLTGVRSDNYSNKIGFSEGKGGVKV